MYKRYIEVFIFLLPLSSFRTQERRCRYRHSSLRRITVLSCPGMKSRTGTLDLGSVYTTPEKFENTALFRRLGLPFTLIRHENGAFRKRF